MKKQNKKLKLTLKLVITLVITIFVAGALFIALSQKVANSESPFKEQVKTKNLTSKTQIELNKDLCLIDEECLTFEIPDQKSSGPIQVQDVE